MNRSPNRLQVFWYAPLRRSLAQLMIVRSLSTIPARSASKLSVGVAAGAAVAGWATYECMSPFGDGSRANDSYEVSFDDGGS